jgi:hypothetical protein
MAPQLLFALRGLKRERFSLSLHTGRMERAAQTTASPEGETPPQCLRCRTVRLTAVPSPAEGEFFRCPNCRREFYRASGGALVFRWGHPISLLLYPVIFDERPGERCAEVARGFAGQHGPAAVRYAIEEIRLELRDPAQPLGEVVRCRASESDLRDFLRCVADRLEALAAG